MATRIITGYTGQRHITAKDDSQVWRAILGKDTEAYILPFGSELAAEMPSINEFQISDGWVSLQGRMIVNAQETLAVDICASGNVRIDLVVIRYTIDSSSNVEAAELMLLKGTEVDASNTPVAPSINSGDIDSGATIVDMPLYQINLAGGTVTFEQLAEVVTASLEDCFITADTKAAYRALGWTEE